MIDGEQGWERRGKKSRIITNSSFEPDLPVLRGSLDLHGAASLTAVFDHL